MQNVAIATIIMLLFLIGIVWLQIFFSKKESKWLGLIIPIICFMFSIITVFSLAMFTPIGSSSVTLIVDGAIVNEQTTTLQSDKPGILSMLASVIPVFLISNIPTLIFSAIHFACREKLKLRDELNKMNVQDL